MFSPTTPSFFKILLSENLQNNNFGIPKKFVRLYGNTLSNEVVLKLPCGLEWKIGLKKSRDNNEMCFDSGWSQFVDFYSLKFGSLIFFTYNGDSKFEAFIFDKTTVEIDYPTKTSPESPLEKPEETRKSQSSKRKRIEQVVISDDEIQILEDYSSEHQKAKEVSLEKRRKTNPVDTDRVEKRTLASPVRSIASKVPKSKIKEKPMNGRSEDSNFVIVIRPSYTKLNHPAIPNNFSMAHIKKDQGVLSLSVSNGRSWSVHYNVRMKRGVTRVAEMARGWFKFVRGNNLNVGDVCKFELIKRKGPLSLKVFISRVSKKASLDKVMTRQASKFSSTNPYFKVVMNPSYVKNGPLSIPKAFSASYLKLKNQTLVLEVGERRWSVSMCVYGLDCKITRGWLKFVREQSLCVGDVCKFELIKSGTKVAMKVSVYRQK